VDIAGQDLEEVGSLNTLRGQLDRDSDWALCS
jgi:hypothetical protein